MRATVLSLSRITLSFRYCIREEVIGMNKFFNKNLITLLILLAIPVFCIVNKAFAADYYPATTTLQYGVTDSKVTNLQEDLKSLGYFYYTPTGYFGSVTRGSVIEFQKNNSLSADGIVGPKTAAELKTDVVLNSSKQYQGVPYQWGGVSPTGFDCSGFTEYVFLKNDIVLPRMAADQFNIGAFILRSNLQPGDLVFFSTYKPGPSHVGIYLGNNKFIQASSSQGVTITDLGNSYFAQRYIGAKRVI